MFEKRIKEINDRKIEIRKMLEGSESVDLNALKTELETLDTEKTSLEERMKMANNINTNTVEVRTIEKPAHTAVDTENVKEKRGKDLKELRNITVGSSDFVLPQYTVSDVKPTFNEVSSIVDAVSIKPLVGGESFEQPYVVSYGEGGYTATTGSDYSETETVFKYASIAKTKITAYQEEPEEVMKLPNADYDTQIVSGIRVALRKKLAKQILIGDGAAGHITGIFSSNATAIDGTTDMSLSAIDENTLDDIIFSYGGDENVEDGAVLVLNRKDLKAFAKVKGADKRRAYDIVLNGNTGTINSIPFIINSACAAVSDATTVAGTYCMAYGSLSNYQLAVFSDMDVQRSTDYKFKQGMICHKGVIFAGGNVVAKNGFIRVKKAAA